MAGPATTTSASASAQAPNATVNPRADRWPSVTDACGIDATTLGPLLVPHPRVEERRSDPINSSAGAEIQPQEPIWLPATSTAPCPTAMSATPAQFTPPPTRIGDSGTKK